MSTPSVPHAPARSKLESLPLLAALRTIEQSCAERGHLAAARLTPASTRAGPSPSTPVAAPGS